MFEKIAGLAGAVVAGTTGGLLTWKTQGAVLPEVVLCVIGGSLLGTLLGVVSCVSEPFYREEGTIFPSVSNSILTGSLSGLFVGVICWAGVGLFVRPLIINIFY